jgi:hypothetical protein
MRVALHDQLSSSFEMRAESEQSLAETQAVATGPPSGDGRAKETGKWWRWYSYVGRWMPSEPPDGEADAAYWCANDVRPAFRGPRSPGADDRRDLAPSAAESSWSLQAGRGRPSEA